MRRFALLDPYSPESQLVYNTMRNIPNLEKIGAVSIASGLVGKKLVQEINEDEQKILWEMKGEGLVNIFKVIDQNTVALTLEDIRMEPSRFVRIN